VMHLPLLPMYALSMPNMHYFFRAYLECIISRCS
jgi:hypothetical protein